MSHARPCQSELACYEEVRGAPELTGTIADASVIERQRDLVDVLMAAVFPRASWEQEYGAAIFPFELERASPAA